MNEVEIIAKVINILGKTSLSKERYSSELENFQNRQIQASLNKYRLGVIGVTSSGKSTMINALLGEPLLPQAARPSSSQLVSCCRSETRKAQVYFLDGKIKSFSGTALNPELIKKYGDESSNNKNKERVKQIELSTPAFSFGKDIILIDSPGLDAYGYEGHEQLTMNSLLPTIDFCIFVTTCKSNSDDKTFSVLNTIAEYEKPVIIVQNMIDSLKPSLDGLKTVADVAQDHRVRLERIIKNSKIRDKSKVHIVQISAIEALRARQGIHHSEETQRLLEKSNYKILVSKVETTINHLRPIVEGHRMTFLKKEIQRIAKAAFEDGSDAHQLVAKFEHENVIEKYNAKRQNCIDKLNNSVESLEGSISRLLYKYNFSESDIKNIEAAANQCETSICEQMKSLNACIKGICESLNVDSRSIMTDFRFEKRSIYLKKKTVIVEEGHFVPGKKHYSWNPFNKLFGVFSKRDPDRWVPAVTKQETDVEATRNTAQKYIENCVSIFSHTISRWEQTIDSVERPLFAEIENRRSEYQARINKALDSQVYLQIGTDLQSIADTIKSVDISASNVCSTKTDVEVKTFQIAIKKELISMYRLSEKLRMKMLHDTIRYIIPSSSRNIVLGWDEYSEAKFVSYAFNRQILPENIHPGKNETKGLAVIIHRPNDAWKHELKVKTNVFILVNATQFGSAMNEIASLNLVHSLGQSDKMFLVVQDFNEIMNGNSVSETLDNIISIVKHQDYHLSGRCYVLLLHENPIYNMAAVEAQVSGSVRQYDEIRILNELQKKFSFLLPRNTLDRNKTESTIRLIIQKLGNV